MSSVDDQREVRPISSRRLWWKRAIETVLGVEGGEGGGEKEGISNQSTSVRGNPTLHCNQRAVPLYT